MQALAPLVLAGHLVGAPVQAHFTIDAPPPDTTRPAVSIMVLPPEWPMLRADLAFGDTAQGRRPKPIEYSDAYYTRLMIHKYASYATVPLFVTEYFVGQSIINQGDTASSSLRNAHS